MGSSLFGSQPGNSLSQLLNSARAIAGGNPQAAISSLMQGNPGFRAFVEANRWKTPQQAFHDYGLDYEQYRRYL